MELLYWKSYQKFMAQKKTTTKKTNQKKRPKITRKQ